METHSRTDDEVYDLGYAAIRDALGVEDGIRFLRLITRSTGDYTMERPLIIGNPTLEELHERIEAMKSRRRAEQEEAA